MQQHRFSYNELMPVESCTQSLCGLALQFGEDDEDKDRMVRIFLKMPIQDNLNLWMSTTQVPVGPDMHAVVWHAVSAICLPPASTCPGLNLRTQSKPDSKPQLMVKHRLRRQL